MKLRFLLPLSLSLSLVSIFAFQTKNKERIAFCGFSLDKGYYYDNVERSYITKEAKSGDKSGIPDAVQEILKSLKLENLSISVYLAKEENNCYATILKDGKRVIIADHLFLNAVDRSSGTRWAAISILAHEIGHHIAGFTRRPSQLESELDADYWSGYALQRLGASKEASVKCIMTFGTEKDTDTHPNKYLRAKTIQQGWEDGITGQYDDDRCGICK